MSDEDDGRRPPADLGEGYFSSSILTLRATTYKDNYYVLIYTG
jgi:hypothetical protein